MVGAEAFTVGAMARRGTQAPLGELLFWAVAGTPFTLLVYIGILHYPSPVCWVLIVTPPLNGFSNALVAQFLETLPGIRNLGRSRARGRPLASAAPPSLPALCLGSRDPSAAGHRGQRASLRGAPVQ